ncbi:hypothetical protein DV737_g794, partial [Chaetothyriales sp. CBS 132003]
MEITEFSSRKGFAEVDCVAICPTYPEYLIYGTYSLIKRREDQELAAQIRSGTIQALPVSPSFKPSFAGGSRAPKLCQHSFPAAVLDLRFHPNDGSLLGVALSDGTIHFFRFVKRADVLNRCWVTELFPLGHAVVGTRDPVTGLVPVVTQFQWLPALYEVGRRDVSNTLTVTIAASLDSGKTANVDLFSSDAPPPTVCFTDGRCHEAGVTAILPLTPPPPPNKGSSTSVPDPVPIPILTGSYDEYIRLFCLSPTSHKLSRQPLASLNLRGGVWRLQLMDHYAGVIAAAQPDTTALLRYQQHYIILVSCMHAGARILRVAITTYHDNDGDGEWKWECDIQMAAVFGRGHETIVYACDFVREWRVAEPELAAGPAWAEVVARRPRTKRALGMAYGGGLDGQSMSHGLLRSVDLHLGVEGRDEAQGC